MCLLVPGRITKIRNGIAEVDYGSEKRTARVIDERIKTGDFVLVQGGVAVERVPREEAEEAIRNYSEMVSGQS